jgi:hypothetical protein
MEVSAGSGSNDIWPTARFTVTGKTRVISGQEPAFLSVARSVVVIPHAMGRSIATSCVRSLSHYPVRDGCAGDHGADKMRLLEESIVRRHAKESVRCITLTQIVDPCYGAIARDVAWADRYKQR